MKPSTPDIIRRQLIPCTLLVALSALIWIGWPQLDTVPPITSRLYLTLALYLTWILKIIFIDFSPGDHPGISLPPELQKPFALLEGRLDGVLRFLHKTPMMHHGVHVHFSVLPWHLIIGPTGSGKTALLAHSGMRFVLSKKFSAETLAEMPASTTAEWWVTRDLALVDTPGHWPLWQGFLKLLQKKQSLARLSGVVLTLNLPELMQAGHHTATERTVDHLRNQIKHLRENINHPLPFYLVITKCDLLRGFGAFFRDCSREDLANAWGVTLPVKEPKERLHDIVTQRFNHLVKQLNSQLVLRLHQERDARLRPLIKDFPLEVEKLRDHLLQTLNLIAPDLPLRGIWLTSATQTEQTLGHSHDLQQAGTHLTLQTPLLFNAALATPKPYFIHHVIQHALPHWSGKVLSQPKHHAALRRSIYALSGGMLLAATVIVGHDFSTSLNQIQTLEKSIQQYEVAIHQAAPLQPTLIETLALVNALEPNALPTADTAQNIRQRLIAFYSVKTQREAWALHLDAVKSLLLPTLSQTLDTWLKMSNSKSSFGQLYSVLSARLMLAGTIPFDAESITKTLTGLSALPNDAQNTQRLMGQLNEIRQLGFTFPEDTQLVAHIRQQLARLPVYQLGMLLLENNFTNTDTSDESLQVPALFTQAQFDSIMRNNLPKASQETINGNAVLGPLHHATRARSNAAAVMTQISNRYQQNYAKAWVQKIHHLSLTKTTDLFATDALVAGFLDGSATEWQALRSVSENTSFSPIMQMNPSLLALDNLFAEDPKDNQSRLYQNKAALNWVHQTLQGILTATDPTQAATLRVMQSLHEPEGNAFSHLRTVAAMNPEPLKEWLIQLADTGWRQMVNQSGIKSINPQLLTAIETAKHPESLPKMAVTMTAASAKKKVHIAESIPPQIKKLMDSEAIAPEKNVINTQGTWSLNLNLPKIESL